MMTNVKYKSASNFSDILDLWRDQPSQLPQMGKHFCSHTGKKKRKKRGNLSYMVTAVGIDDLFPIKVSFQSTNREAMLIENYK